MEQIRGGEHEQDTEGGAKRPYQRPRILHRQPLEVMATVCAPQPPAKMNRGMCPQGPISS